MIVLNSLAALEVLEMDLSTLQQKLELQYAHLQVLRDQKLAEVKQATYASTVTTNVLYLNIVLCYYTHRDNFAKYMKDTAITAVHSRTGRRLHSQVNRAGVMKLIVMHCAHMITAGGGAVPSSRRQERAGTNTGVFGN